MVVCSIATEFHCAITVDKSASEGSSVFTYKLRNSYRVVTPFQHLPVNVLTPAFALSQSFRLLALSLDVLVDWFSWRICGPVKGLHLVQDDIARIDITTDLLVRRKVTHGVNTQVGVGFAGLVRIRFAAEAHRLKQRSQLIAGVVDFKASIS